MFDCDKLPDLYLDLSDLQSDLSQLQNNLNSLETEFSDKQSELSVKQAELDTINDSISAKKVEIDNQETVLGNARNEYLEAIKAVQMVGILNAQIASFQKQKTTLENFISENETQSLNVWCVDLTTDLSGDVGILNIPSETKLVNIKPGYTSAAYSKANDGELSPSMNSTGPNQWLQISFVPATRKFYPSFRYGTVAAINYDADTATVDLDAAVMRYMFGRVDLNRQTTLSNIPVEYMQCNASAFEVGDSVVVKFENNKWTGGKVIGFKDNPQPCGGDMFAVVEWVGIYYRWYQPDYNSPRRFVLFDLKMGRAVSSITVDGYGITCPGEFDDAGDAPEFLDRFGYAYRSYWAQEQTGNPYPPGYDLYTIYNSTVMPSWVGPVGNTSPAPPYSTDYYCTGIEADHPVTGVKYRIGLFGYNYMEDYRFTDSADRLVSMSVRLNLNGAVDTPWNDWLRDLIMDSTALDEPPADYDLKAIWHGVYNGSYFGLLYIPPDLQPEITYVEAL